MFTLVIATLAVTSPTLTYRASPNQVSVTQLGSIETYRIDAPTGTVSRDADTTLHFAYRSFEPLTESDGVPDALRSRPGEQLRVVQFWTVPLDAYRAAITRLGGKIRKYVPGQAYIVAANDKVAAQLARLEFVRFVGSYHPAYRLSNAVLGAMSGGGSESRRYSFLLFEAGASMKNRVSSRLRSMNARIDDETPQGHVLEATLTPSQLSEAMHWDEVMFIDLWTPAEYDLDIARMISGTNDLETVAGFSGQGVRGQVRDGGVRATHDSFDSRPLIILSNTTDTSHGTCTMGIVFGDGTGNAAGRGILPAGQGIFRSGLATGGTRYSHTQTLINTYQGVFESNSTGSALTMFYGTESANLDDIIFDLDILICQSQSNAASQQSRPQAWAKNIVSVGGIHHYNTLSIADDTWTNTSAASIGPAADGRIKPDVSHFYDSILCPADTSDVGYTTSFGGTSGATPITCGHFGLIYQMWAAGVFGNTVTGTDVFTSRCHATTAKALMVNTARMYDFSGSAADLSRYKQGWGRAHVKRLYDLRDKMVVRNEEDVLAQFQATTRNVYVAPGEPELKVTMCYRDPMGNPAIQAQHRVNDLTLKVVSPSGAIYFGNNGLTTGNASTSGGVSNTKDTVENVFVQNPEVGVWSIQVSADEIVEDAYVADGPVNATFALVASGVTEVLAPTYSLTTGSAVAGSFANMATSDNTRYAARPGAVLVPTSPPLVLQADTVSPLASPSEFRIKIESSATVSNLVQRVLMLNVGTGLYDEVDSRTLATADGTTEVIVPGAASYVSVGGAVRCRFTWKPSGATLVFPWNAAVDQIRITMRP